MFLPAHDQRSPRICIGENRFIFDTQTAPNPLEQQLMNVLPREATDDELDALSQQIETQKSSDVLQKVRTSLDALKPREKSIVQYNILRIQARIDVKTQTAEQGRALQANIEAMRKQIENNTPALTPTADTTTPDTMPASTTTNPSAPPARTKPEEPKTIMEKIGKTALDIKEDFSKGNNWTKAGYVAGGVVGFLAARWLWKKTFGTGANDGLVKTSGKWLLTIGAGIAGVVGMKALKDKWQGALAKTVSDGLGDKDKDNPFIPNAIEDPVEGAISGAARGVEKAKEALGPVAERLWDLPNVGPVLKKWLSDKPYESEAAFIADLALGLIKDGVPLTLLGGKAAMLIGTNLYKDIGGLVTKAITLALDPSWDNFEEVVAVYVEGGVLYASGVGALQAIMLRNPMRAVKQALVWPYHVIRKTGSVTFGCLNGQTWNAIKDVGFTRPALYYKFNAQRSSRILNAVGIRKTPVLQTYLAQEEMLKGYKDLLLSMEGNKVISDVTKTKVLDEANSVLKSMRNTLAKLQESGALPKEIQDYLDAEFKYGKNVIGEMALHEVEEIINHTKPGGSASGPSIAPKPTVPPGPKVNPAPLTKEGKAMSKLMDSPEWGPILKKMGGKVAANDVEAFLELARDAKLMELDPSTLALIRDSKQAKAIIAGAVDTADVAEVTRALNAAKSAAKWRVAGNAAGAAGDVFGLWMAYEDWKANDQKIAATSNVALKDLYKDAKIANAIEGTTSGVSLIIGGYAFCSSLIAGEGLLAAAGAVGGTIMLPVGIAVGVGVYGKKKLQDVAEEWLNEEKDWAKKSSGELLAAQAKLGPGKHGYWQGAANGTRIENWYQWATKDAKQFEAWEDAGAKRVEDANGGARYQITRAYIAKMTELPQKNGESDAAYKSRFAEFQRLQIGFVADNTNGAFGETLNLVYRNAHTHAEIKIMSEELKKNGGSQKVNIVKTDNKGQLVEKQFDIANYGEFKNQNDRNADGITPLDVIVAYQKQKQATTLLQVQMLAKMDGSGNESVPMQDAILQNTLLQEVRYDMTLCDKKMRETDFAGWGWTGGEEGSRGIARYVMNVELRKLLRNESDRLREKTGATQIDLDYSIQTLRAFLQQEPANFEAIAKKNKYGGAAEFANNSEVLTDYRWTREHLYLHPPAAPQLKDAA